MYVAIDIAWLTIKLAVWRAQIVKECFGLAFTSITQVDLCACVRVGGACEGV